MLSKCRTCKHPVSTNASTCPDCGEYNPSPERYADELERQDREVSDAFIVYAFLFGAIVYLMVIWTIT